MSIFTIEDLPQRHNFDQKAMEEIIGGGPWSSVKKISRKAGRHLKKKARGPVLQYKIAYYGGPDTVDA